jgi:hypothetical protein
VKLTKLTDKQAEYIGVPRRVRSSRIIIATDLKSVQTKGSALLRRAAFFVAYFTHSRHAQLCIRRWQQFSTGSDLSDR